MAPIKDTKQPTANTNNIHNDTNDANSSAGPPSSRAANIAAVIAAAINNSFGSTTSGSSNSLSNFNHSNNFNNNVNSTNNNNNHNHSSFSNNQSQQNCFSATGPLPSTSIQTTTPAARGKYTGAVPKTVMAPPPPAAAATAATSLDAEVTANLHLPSRYAALGTTMSQQQKPAEKQLQPPPLPQQPILMPMSAMPPEPTLDHPLAREIVAQFRLAGQPEKKSDEQRKQQQKRRNTEIVAPIRRELNDLNDYFLSTVEIAGHRRVSNYNSNTTNTTTNDLNNRSGQAHSAIAVGGGQQTYRREALLQPLTDNHHNSNGVDNLHENQRFCYPVRPIPRRNHQLSQQSLPQSLQSNVISSSFSLSAPNLITAATTSTAPSVSNASNIACCATVGIVTPTTPISSTTVDGLAAYGSEDTSNFDQRQTLLLRQHRLQQELIEQLHSLLNEPLTVEAATVAAKTVVSAARTDPLQNQQRHQLQQQLQQQQQQQQFQQQQLRHLFRKQQGQKQLQTHLLQQELQHQQHQQHQKQIAHLRAINKKYQQRTKMVHDTNPNQLDRDLLVNSTSLEDVPLSEASDNRAQSIQSLHSAVETTPTPEATPSYDDLQMRLQISNQNIRTMHEQQEHLMRLQVVAKKQLADMEELRNAADTLSFNANNDGGAASTSGGVGKNSDGSPEYQNIEQVHADMASLVSRMKNLTVFIQNQNELSNLLGDDGPEILAEQQALQRKLEDLRTQRDEMRNLVHELQDINRTAEQTALLARDETRDSSVETVVGEQKSINTDRNVPVEYLRVVPIQMLSGNSAGGSQTSRNISAAERCAAEANVVDDAVETSELIVQKVADIEAMKSQLKYLKEMMETVSLIEEHTARDSSQIGRSTTSPHEQTRSRSRSPSHSSTVAYDRDRTPVVPIAAAVADSTRDTRVPKKMRMLNEVSSDLHQQAEDLHVERERIKELKREIARRKDQAAAAAQLGEDALLRHSLTPTPTPSASPNDVPMTALQGRQERHQLERDQLKHEYELKKKEFEELCKRLQQEDVDGSSGTNRTTTRRHDVVSEADDEDEADVESETNHSVRAVTANIVRNYFTTPAGNNVTTSAAAGANSSPIRDTGPDASGSGGVGAPPNMASLQSGSARPFSIPPAMAHMNPPNWHNKSQEGDTGAADCSIHRPTQPLAESPFAEARRPSNTTPPAGGWNTHFYYGDMGHGTAAPYSPQLFNGLPNASTSTAPPTPPPRALGNVCVCNAATNTAASSNEGGGGRTATGELPSASANAQTLSRDPLLLQQFVQTQQMLINSVCQCNQMLWQQQREMDILNYSMQLLQERISALAGMRGMGVIPDLGTFNLRAESVPPIPLAGGVPNNLFIGHNRAQSEQPGAGFMPVSAALAAAATNSLGAGTSVTGTRNAFAATSYQQQQQQLQNQLLQQQQQHQQNVLQHRQHRNVGMYSFSNELIQHTQNAASSGANIYSTLNNAMPATQSSTPQSSHFNNEIASTATATATASNEHATSMAGGGGGGAGPGPIFMNHHNNAIHQNNANLRTQNHHANNLHNNIGGAGCGVGIASSGGSACNNNTLNNQVPPGNRANNYWDNFRSYSRQNLLSTNSNKSNEEAHLNQNQQQQLQQPPPQLTQQHEQEDEVNRRSRLRHQLWRDYERRQQTEAEGAQRDDGNNDDVAVEDSDTDPYEPNRPEINVRQQHQAQPRYRGQQQQQQQQPAPGYSAATPLNNCNIGNNNLNYERNNNKLLRSLQRSSINQEENQQQLLQQQSQQQHDQRRQQQQHEQQHQETKQIASNIGKLLCSNYSNLYRHVAALTAPNTAATSHLRQPADRNWLFNNGNEDDADGNVDVDIDIDVDDDDDDDDDGDVVNADVVEAEVAFDLNLGEEVDDDDDEDDDDNDDEDEDGLDVDNVNVNQNQNHNDNDNYNNYNIVAGVPVHYSTQTVQVLDTSSTERQRQSNMNVNFGSSPHYQRQKVTTKVAAPHSRNSSTYRPEQRQAQQRLDSAPSGSGGAHTAREHNRNREYEQAQQVPERGFLVRSDDDGNDYVFVVGNESSFGDDDIVIDYTVLPNVGDGRSRRRHNRNRRGPDNSPEQPADDGDNDNNVAGDDIMEDVMDDVIDVMNDEVEVEEDTEDNEKRATGRVGRDIDADDDDTISEEINRNLLANALKNEKFTSKVYESIKKDVFRRLESMLLENDSETEQQHYQRLLAHLYHPNADRSATNEPSTNGAGDDANAAKAADDPVASTSSAAAAGGAANRTDCETLDRYYVELKRSRQYLSHKALYMQRKQLLEENKSDQNNSQGNNSNANANANNNSQNSSQNNASNIQNNTQSTSNQNNSNNNNQHDEQSEQSIQNTQSIQSAQTNQILSFMQNIQSVKNNHNNNCPTGANASQDNLNVVDDKKSKQVGDKNDNCRYLLGSAATETTDDDNVDDGGDGITMPSLVSFRYSEDEADVDMRNVTVAAPTRWSNWQHSVSSGDANRQPQLATIESDGATPTSPDNDDDKQKQCGSNQLAVCHSENNEYSEPTLSTASIGNGTQPQEAIEQASAPMQLKHESPAKEDEIYAKTVKLDRQQPKQQLKVDQNQSASELPKLMDWSEQPSTSQAAKQSQSYGKNHKRVKRIKKTSSGDEKTPQSQSAEVDANNASAFVDDEPEHELIRNIIMRIRVYTHGSSVINDSMLVAITKMTSATAKSSIATCNPPVLAAPNLSPKRLYAKIKKQPIPRGREEFLAWYQNYLSSIFMFQQQFGQSPITITTINKKAHKAACGGGAIKKTTPNSATTTTTANTDIDNCPTTSVVGAANNVACAQVKDRDDQQPAAEIVPLDSEQTQEARNNDAEENTAQDEADHSTGENDAVNQKQ